MPSPNSRDVQERIAALSLEQRARLEARLLERRKSASTVAVIPRRSDDGPSPLSFPQDRLWFLGQVFAEQSSYNLPRAYRLHGRLDADALARSLAEIVRRHEALRTTFVAENGVPHQVVRPVEAFDLKIFDFSDLPPEERDQETREQVHAVTARPFDLARDLPIRAALIKQTEAEHIFALSVHHISSDHWSNEILWRELVEAYNAYSSGRDPMLPELPIQYSDFAVWQLQQSETPAFGRQLDYWLEKLRDIPDQLVIPTDYPRTETLESRGTTIEHPLSSGLSRELKALGQSEQASLFMTLLAGLDVLLWRLSGQEDVVVGAPVAGRQMRETQGLVGVFLNHLVLRVNVTGDSTFRDLLRQARSTALEAYANQAVPFEMLLTKLPTERTTGRTPLFQVFLNMPGSAREEPLFQGLSVAAYPLERQSENFDSTFYIVEVGESIRIFASYRTALFKAERMTAMLGEYEKLLSQAVASPDRSVGSYSLVTDAARSVLPDPTEPLAGTWHGSLPGAVSKHAQVAPESLAVRDSHEQWSYEDLECHSSRLAHKLVAGGIRPGDVVAIYAERRAALVVALLGVLRAGGAFLILDPAYPPRRLADYLSAARPRGWIQMTAPDEVPPELVDWLSSADLPCRVEMPDLAGFKSMAEWQGWPATPPEVVIGPDSLACISFTSGSSGRPKGVLCRHGSLTHFLPWQQQTFGLTPADRFSVLSGLSHDPLQRDIFTALWAGAAVCAPDPDQIFTPFWLADWMRDEEITFAHLTPGMGRVLTETARPGARLEKLRHAFFVGDKLTRGDVANLRRIAPGVTVINSYGATETQRAVACSILPPGSEEEPPMPILPIGRGIPDAQLLILTEGGQLAGIGELGEIHVRSPHLALGYLDDEALTEERFLINPFTGDPTDRIYRTGDLGRYQLDGQVRVAGRRDAQVKVRGFRIELGEVEAALNDLDEVSQAVVVTYEQQPGELALAAYIVPEAGVEPTPGKLRNLLAARLPSHMLPASYVLLERMPLTPNRKIDRAALPDPRSDRIEPTDAYMAPRSSTEERLAAIWAEVLGVDRVGVRDNFFDLGGHSLLGARLFARIEAAFDMKVPLALLFEAQTVTELASRLDAAGAGLVEKAVVPFHVDGHRSPFFCVHGIGGGLLDHAHLARLLGPDRPFYGLRDTGEVDGAATERVIEEMATRYVAAMREVQPQGPYRLGGYCFGGVVAFEMARQLETQGERVALLAIMEGSAPGVRTARPPLLAPERWRAVRRSLPYWIRDVRVSGSADFWRRARTKVRRWELRWRHRLGLRTEATLQDVFPVDTSTVSPAQQTLMYCHLKAQHSYIPRHYGGRIDLFLAKGRTVSQALYGSLDATAGWGQVASEVDVCVVEGLHRNIHLPPYVTSLGAELAARLDRSDG